MNHPKHEDWVPYLYGEAKPDIREQLKGHLKECAECRDELAAWKRSLNRLDAWKLPRTATRFETAAPLLKWAAAALCVVVLGFGLGRVTARQASMEQIRAQLEPRIRQDLRAELAGMLEQQLRDASAATLAQAQRHNEEVAGAYYALLKKDIDTLAINTDVGLRQTEQALVQIADNTQAADPSKVNHQ
jgi:hypothetical protein